MQDGMTASLGVDQPSATPTVEQHGESETAESETVSTHVLVAEEQVERLRQLSRKTRIAQSEYLREAVEDLLTKYGKAPSEER